METTIISVTDFSSWLVKNETDVHAAVGYRGAA